MFGELSVRMSAVVVNVIITPFYHEVFWVSQIFPYVESVLFAQLIAAFISLIGW